MRTRVSPLLASLITLSMVVFGQVCAFSTMAQPQASDGAVELEVAAGGDEHAGTCTSEECGGDGEGEGHCASGAAFCCSTWAPPSDPVSLSPPQSIRLGPADAWTALAATVVTEDGAQEVAPFRLARPPVTANVLRSSSLSRRGPPALS